MHTMTMLLVDCSVCRTPLQLPPGARSIRCVLCNAVTPVASAQAPPLLPSTAVPFPSSSYSPYPTPPSPSGGAPWGPPPSPHGRKRAVIIGISYRSSWYEQLDGCINDAKCMRYLLVNRFSFPESSIVMLTDEETDPHKLPTKQNIRMAMYWLLQGCQPGDSLVFHYSGHGFQQRSYNYDELDGYDETLCPMDFETQGMIVDDEINATIVRPLPWGVKLHAIIDSCHSGTMLDLPFLCRMNQTGHYVWEDHRPRSGLWKGTNGGEAISFSGCDDHQTAADTSALSRVTSTGAMTYCFIQALEQGHGATYGSILNSIRSKIRNAGAGDPFSGGYVSSLQTMMTGDGLGGRLRQEPQLTSSEGFDVYRKPFAL